VAGSQRKALSLHRKRLRRRGIARLEVRVKQDDVALVKRVVEALSDPAREREARALLRDRFGGARGFKALLASAPLEGIDLERARDFGRDAEA
jgi:hypothetical protein